MKNIGVEQRAFDAIAAVDAASNMNDIFKVVQDMSSEYGMPHFLITGVPLPGETLAQHILMSGWPSEWKDRYDSKSYVHIDPIANFICRSNRPFCWHEVKYDRGKHKRAHLVMEEAREFGMAAG